MFRPFAQLPTACCCVLLKVVAQNLKLVKLLSQQLPTFPPFRDRRSVAQQCLIRCTALPTLLGPRTCITYALQSLMGFILYTMHCSSQHCWELLHPFIHHYQHGRNSSQQCWELLRSFIHHYQHGRNSSQHCWELLHPFIHHYQHGRNSSQQCWELLRSFARSFSNTKTRNSQLLRQVRHSLNYDRGTQREHSSKPLNYSIVKRVLVFKR